MVIPTAGECLKTRTRDLLNRNRDGRLVRMWPKMTPLSFELVERRAAESLVALPGMPAFS